MTSKLKIKLLLIIRFTSKLSYDFKYLHIRAYTRLKKNL